MKKHLLSCLFCFVCVFAYSQPSLQLMSAIKVTPNVPISYVTVTADIKNNGTYGLLDFECVLESTGGSFLSVIKKISGITFYIGERKKIKFEGQINAAVGNYKIKIKCTTPNILSSGIYQNPIPFTVQQDYWPRSAKEGYFFYTGNHPDNEETDWCNNKWAAAGLANDGDNWFIISHDRNLLGVTNAEDFTMWKIPANIDLNSNLSNYSSVKKFNLKSSSTPSIFKKYGHAGDIDVCTAPDGKDYVIVPLYSKVSGYKDRAVIAFFKASNLELVNYVYLPTSIQTTTGWCAVNIEGGDSLLYTSTSWAKDLICYDIKWKYILYHPTDHYNGLKIKNNKINIKDEWGNDITIPNMQGGEFSENGLLYISSGVVGFFSNSGEYQDGIHVFQKTSPSLFSRIQRSTNTKRFPYNRFCFDYSFNINAFAALGEEPEGLTIWDKTNVNINGQLHVLLDNHKLFANKGIICRYKEFKGPGDITVFGTTINGEPATNSQIKSFLTHGSPIPPLPLQLVGGCSYLTHDAPTVFPPGKTRVIFTITDYNSFEIKDTAYVTVKNKHDECSTALKLNACTPVTTDNHCAGQSVSLPPIDGYNGTIKDVWFQITPTRNFSIETLQENNGLTNTVMQLFEGTCDNLTPVASDDTSGEGDHSKITVFNYYGVKPMYVRVTDFDANNHGEFGIYYKNIEQGANLFADSSYQAGDGNAVHKYPTLTGDVNGDGKTDLIYVGQDWNGSGLNIRTKLSNGDGSFTEHYQVLGDGLGVHQYPTLTGDVDGDGKTDLIFIFQHWNGSGLTIRTKFYNGNGTYVGATASLGDGSAVHEYPTLAGDMNGDGKTDLVFIFNSNNDGLVVRTKISDINGSFIEHENKLGDGSGVHEYPTLIGDVNGDGKSDLIFIFNTNSNGLTIRTKMSKGDGTYEEYENILGDGDGVHKYPTLIGDVNGDNKSDLIFVGQDWSGNGLNIRTKMSNGDGTYAEYSQVLGDGSAIHKYPTLIGDINGDGKSDLIFVGQDWKGCGLNIRVKFSNGDGTWCSDFQTLGDGDGVHGYSTFIGDGNGDGKSDLYFTFQHWNGSGLHIRTKFSQSTNCSALISNENTALESLTIFPNPVNNSFTIATESEFTMDIRIFSASGVPIKYFSNLNSSYVFDVHSLPNGVYLIEISDVNSRARIVKRFVKIE